MVWRAASGLLLCLFKQPSHITLWHCRQQTSAERERQARHRRLACDFVADDLRGDMVGLTLLVAAAWRPSLIWFRRKSSGRPVNPSSGLIVFRLHMGQVIASTSGSASFSRQARQNVWPQCKSFGCVNVPKHIEQFRRDSISGTFSMEVIVTVWNRWQRLDEVWISTLFSYAEEWCLPVDVFTPLRTTAKYEIKFRN